MTNRADGGLTRPPAIATAMHEARLPCRASTVSSSSSSPAARTWARKSSSYVTRPKSML
jgi:hypothetical protein